MSFLTILCNVFFDRKSDDDRLMELNRNKLRDVREYIVSTKRADIKL